MAAGAEAEFELLLFAAGSEPHAVSTRAALATMPIAPRGRMIFTAFPPLGVLRDRRAGSPAPDPDIRQPRWTGGPFQVNEK
ncbi:hypothetical protein GCM10023192_41990 [Amycolatopsis samaneae]